MFEVSFAISYAIYTPLQRLTVTIPSFVPSSTFSIGSWHILIWAFTREMVELIKTSVFFAIEKNIFFTVFSDMGFISHIVRNICNRDFRHEFFLISSKQKLTEKVDINVSLNSLSFTLFGTFINILVPLLIFWYLY